MNKRARGLALGVVFVASACGGSLRGDAETPAAAQKMAANPAMPPSKAMPEHAAVLGTNLSRSATDFEDSDASPASAEANRAVDESEAEGRVAKSDSPMQGSGSPGSAALAVEPTSDGAATPTAESAGSELPPDMPLPSEPEEPQSTPPVNVQGSGMGKAPESPAEMAQASESIRQMMDIEAHLAVEVRSIEATVTTVRSLVQAAGGQILEESLDEASQEKPSAALVLRIPSAGAFDFLARLEATGVVRSRQVSSRDVGKEYFDATLRLNSLQRVLRRYHALLASAQTVEDTLKVEEQIARVSGEIEKIKGQLRWLRDRVARATVHLQIFAKGDWVEKVVTPEAKFYPGVRAGGAWDWRGTESSQTVAGGGFSLRFDRYFSIDFDAYQNLDEPRGDFETTLLTLGGEMYSEFLGAGQNHWLNPYLGFRGGYARVDGNDQLLLGGALGLELFKNEYATVDMDVRILGAFGDDLGSHLIIQPALGTNLAF